MNLHSGTKDSYRFESLLYSTRFDLYGRGLVNTNSTFAQLLQQARGGWQMAENLSAGVRVRLHSLQAAAQHNGVDGHLLKWNASTGRWHVKLSTGPDLSVRPANVMMIGRAPTAREKRVYVKMSVCF